MAQYKTFSSMNNNEQDFTSEYISEVPRISNIKERQTLIQNNKIVVIDNYTDWCGPCKQCAPQFAKLAKKYSKPGMCAFAKENVDDKCGGWPVQIRGVPCFHFYVNGHYQDEMTITGADVGAIEQTLQRLFA